MSRLIDQCDKELMVFGDKLWQMVVSHQAQYRCRRCGDLVYRGCHHIVGRRKLKFRFKPEYGYCCCGTCHSLIHQRGDSWFLSEIQESLPEMFNRIETHRMTENTATIGEIYDDIRELECYLRTHKLYPADENRTVIDEYSTTNIIR